jgi:hypothetical protein
VTAASPVDSEAHAQRYDLGILFVHGIGDQPRAATLVDFGTPLIEWLSDRASAESGGAQVLNADLMPQDDIPAHAEVRIEAKSIVRHWLIAESWWAQTFLAPRFADLARWGFAIVPWTFSWHSGARLRDVWRERTSDAMNRLQWLGRLINATVSLLGGMVLSICVLLMLTMLLGLGLIPSTTLRSAIATIQLRLASSIGDCYILITRPIEAAAIYSRFLRDLAWLASHCKKVAVVAHSQGAAVACRALYEQLQLTKGGPDFACTGTGLLLLTLGSGLQKLEEQRELRSRPEFRRGAAFTLCGLVIVGIVAASLPGTLILMHIGIESTARVFLLLAFGAIGLAVLGAGVHDIIGGDEPEELGKLRLELGSGRLKWKDYYASADPVPGGALGDGDLLPPESTEVVNLRSPIRDHNSYWRNKDEFVTLVSNSLLEFDESLSALTIDPSAINFLRRCRSYRVTWLRVAWWVTFLSVVAVVIHYRRDWLAVAGWIMYRAEVWIGGVVGLIPKPIPLPDVVVWGHSLGWGALVLVVHAVGRWRWAVWNQTEMDKILPQKHGGQMEIEKGSVVLLIAFQFIFGGIALSGGDPPPWLSVATVPFFVLIIFAFLLGEPTSPPGALSERVEADRQQPLAVRTASTVWNVLTIVSVLVGFLLGFFAIVQWVRNLLRPFLHTSWFSWLAAFVVVIVGLSTGAYLIVWLIQVYIGFRKRDQHPT